MKPKRKYFNKAVSYFNTKHILAYMPLDGDTLYCFEKPNKKDFLGIFVRQIDNSYGIIPHTNLNYDKLPKLIT